MNTPAKKIALFFWVGYKIGQLWQYDTFNLFYLFQPLVMKKNVIFHIFYARVKRALEKFNFSSLKKKSKTTETDVSIGH